MGVMITEESRPLGVIHSQWQLRYEVRYGARRPGALVALYIEEGGTRSYL